MKIFILGDSMIKRCPRIGNIEKIRRCMFLFVCQYEMHERLSQTLSSRRVT